MNLHLSEKKALIMGSTQGIGFAVACELAGLGARVYLSGRDEATLQRCLRDLPGEGHGYLVADQSDVSGFANALEAFLKEHPCIHILINNSGGPPAGPIASADPEAFRIAFNQHLVINHTLMKGLLPGMKAAGYGRIINIISTSVKQPLKGLGVSNTIRAAVANWSKTLSSEVAAFGITVNNVLPGATRTQRLEAIIRDKAVRTGKNTEETEQEMLSEIPAGRFAEPAEIASVVAFLASPSASYITGINVPVDGGRTLSL